ncbi:MAG: CBS domain-containing protein, partial [Planctomycetota bacterium]
MHDIYSLTAGDLMTPNVDTVSEGDSVRNAIEKMVGLEISALPVVAAGGRCVGVITKTDIIKFLG